MLETTRLKIVPLTHAQLLLYKNDPPALYDNLGVLYQTRQHDPATIGDVAEALEFWISHTFKHPDQFEWYTNWEIILKKEQVAIGGIGFTGFPDEVGTTMVGYGLDMRYHGKGYATEALTALITWAFDEPTLKSILADSPVLHAASHRVLIKNNFIESHRDEILTHWRLDITK
jgi:[ribosomal protein S5]-alanine N-acetyltransferase